MDAFRRWLDMQYGGELLAFDRRNDEVALHASNLVFIVEIGFVSNDFRGTEVAVDQFVDDEVSFGVVRFR